MKKLRYATGVAKKVGFAITYDTVNTYAKSEIAQKYRIAVIAAKAVISPAWMVSIFFMGTWVKGEIMGRNKLLHKLAFKRDDGLGRKRKGYKMTRINECLTINY